ncbi:hypothetical protein GMSM_23390 [Geomonas sp. Red276]
MLLHVAVLIFLTAFCAFVALWLAWRERSASPRAELKRRLQQLSRVSPKAVPEELKAEIAKEAKPTDLFFARFPLTRNLSVKLDRAGLAVTVSLFVAGMFAAALVVLLLVVLLVKSLLLGLAASVATVLAGDLFLKIRAQIRLEKFTEQFPDALTMIARSLRAGHSFTTAIQLVGQELAPPVGDLFKLAYDQQQLGLRLTDALAELNGRLDSLDLRFFTTVVSINTEIGGNLSDVLDKLALTIRERLRIRRQVRVFTAQGRMSGYVLGGLPIASFVTISFVYPEYEKALFTEPMGIYIVVFATVLQLFGLMVIRRIIRIQI